MYRKLAYAVALVGAGAVATAVGCGGDDTSPNRTYDFSMNSGNNDGSANVDGNSDAKVTNYVATSPNQVDTDVIGGNFANGAAVSMTGLIVLADPVGFSAKIKVTGDGCRYEVWAQDPTCSAPPCGITLETQAITNPNGTGQECPFAEDLTNTDNVMQKTRYGDVVTLKGFVDNFPHTGAATDGGASGTVNAHQIELTMLTSTATKHALPTAVMVDPTAFVPYTGTGWAKYEGMYVTLMGPLTTTLSTSSSYTDVCSGVTGKTNGSFTTSPGGAYFADTYNFDYINKDMGETINCWPTNGSSFKSISGIVSTGFGGSILPTTATDFVE